MHELIKLNAIQCVDLLHKGEITATDLVDASYQRIREVNPRINALPVLCEDRARSQAQALSEQSHAGKTLSLLAGLPIAVKDYNDVGDIRTTYGSPLFADNVAQKSDATVETLEQNGAIPVAKANVPEWAGGHTFNPVFGATKNPWDGSKSAGGSSGGSAAALATGMVWLATGNDLGGSLRTPAAFNSVVGFRPSPGIVPRGTRLQPFDTLWVEGPMARNVRDVALMLDAGAGYHRDDPLSIPSTGGQYQGALLDAPLPTRVGFSTNLGIVPMASEIATVCAQAVTKLDAVNVDVTEETPNFDGAVDGFQTLRGVLLGTMMGDLLAQHRKDIAPDIVSNIELGMNVTSDQLFIAERARWKLQQRVSEFFQTHDVLICPTASIPPFPAEQPFVEEIDGTPLNSYIDWFSITFALSMTACPVVSVPCGFTSDGLPVAVQLMGKPRQEAALLRAAALLEDTLALAEQVPIDPRN